MSDAFNMAFFSVGLCIGVFQAYGSYCDIKKPIIGDAIVVVFLDLIFSIVAAFGSWSIIGYLQASNNKAYAQNSSIGLAYIAYPVAA